MSLCFQSLYNVYLQQNNAFIPALWGWAHRGTQQKRWEVTVIAPKLHLLPLFNGWASELCFHFNSCLKRNSFLWISIRKGNAKRCLDLSGWLFKHDFEAQSILVRFLYIVSVYWTYIFFLKQKVQQNSIDVDIVVTKWHRSLYKKHGGETH